jgi:hypothetical protein
MLVALILFFAIGLLPLFAHEFRNNARLLLAYWFVIFLHQTVAFTNAYLFLTIGATGDAETFHGNAELLAQSGDFFYSVGSKLYLNFLGFIYWLFEPSKLLGEQCSILAFAISCIVLIKILGLLGLSRYRVSVLIVFGALPSMVFFTSVTLREAYQIMFFMLAVYFGIKMYLGRSAGVDVFFLIASALLMGLLHLAMIVYALFLIILFMLWTPYPGSSVLRVNKRHLIVVLATITLLVVPLFSIKEEMFDISTSDFFPIEWSVEGMLDVIYRHRTSFYTRPASIEAKATYIVNPDFSSFFSTIRTFFLMHINYLFTPFPWQIKRIIDVYASMESLFRMVLIYYSVKHWYASHGVQRRLLGLMLILFFSMTFIWSVGTSNYGTAARHTLLAWWILSISGVPPLMKMLSRFRLT